MSEAKLREFIKRWSKNAGRCGISPESRAHAEGIYRVVRALEQILAAQQPDHGPFVYTERKLKERS